MAARPTWKGFLKISLVNIPVRVFPATDAAATIGFNQLHAECQTRIQQKRWCPSCEREVPMSEIAKGYEFEKGRYVVMSDEDMAKVRPESTRVIDLVQFTDAAAIDPIYVERPYYLAPDGQDLGPVDPPAHWCEVPAFDWPPPDPPTARRPRKKPPPRAPRAMRVGGRLLAVGRGHEHLTLGDAWPFGHSLGLGDLCLRVVSIEWRAPGHDGITFLCGRPAGHTGECQG